MMTCDACRRSLAAQNAAQNADDALPAAVADHIAGCPDCAAVLVQERHVRSTLAAAPWPSSALAGDLHRLTTFAVAHEAERRLRHLRLARRWAGGIGLLAVVTWLGVRIARSPTVHVDAVDLGWLRPALMVGLGLAAWTWLDVVGRRLATASATSAAQHGVGLGRAAIGLALVVAVIEPSRLAELPYTVARLAGGPAEAQSGIVEAELLCAAASDGRLRLAPASEGCRGHEVEVILDGKAGGDGAPAVDGLAIRVGTATIPAGEWGISVAITPPMDNANYRILFSPHAPNKPITADDACHLLGAGVGSTDHFSIDLRRCWYEGIDVPADRVASDVTVDWVVIGGR